MKKNIEARNKKLQRHGYQEWYWGNDTLWIRGNAKLGVWDGYHEWRRSDGKIGVLRFFIL